MIPDNRYRQSVELVVSNMKADQSPTADGKISADNLSAEGFIAQRLQESEAQEPTETEEVETEEEEVEDADESEMDEHDETIETEEDETEESEEEEEPEASDEIDLLDLSPEQIQALAKKGKSRLLKDVGKLRAENRALEQRLANLESQGQKKTKEIPTEANPFGSLKTLDEIQSKADELESTLETTDRLLEEYEDYGPDDLIQVGQKQFTKKQLRIANRNAREAITKYLPAQQKYIAKVANLEAASVEYMAAAEKEIPEIKDDKSEIGKFFRLITSDPLIAQVKEKIPELGYQMEYILAHAARSIKSKASKIPQGSGTRLKVKLPASPAGSAQGSRGGSAKSSQVEALRARYEKTGSTADWQALRIAEMQ